ncbi:hypothetical protein F2P56_030114 [Juglans regia]|uniref:Reverse transcriptase zinc-binding domain-containing protein n=1 Tax=Juglans regia TaxID=51240 RepID=A0A833WYZ3_JUGRE|nr:hypothetical protein F2P56_030114 [Juglans regia]
MAMELDPPSPAGQIHDGIDGGRFPKKFQDLNLYGDSNCQKISFNMPRPKSKLKAKQSRSIVKEPKCPICLLEVESVMHAIWNCSAVSDVWAEEWSPVKKWWSGEQSFTQL